MREILFKAKRIDNGEWVEGYYFCMVHDDGRHIHHFIMPLGADLNLGTPIEKIQVEIDENTICQYTGLTDKNGNKIWENDVVKHYYNQNKPTRFTIGTICWNADKMRYERYERSSQYEHKIFSVSYDCVYEVIGNIFDNPELLEGGAE